MWITLTVISVITGSLAATYNKVLGQKGYTPLQINFASSFLAGVIILFLAINELKAVDYSFLLHPTNAFFIVGFIIVASFISGLLYTDVAKSKDLSVIGTIENTRPFFTLIVSYFLISQGASFLMILGIIVMFLGLNILNFKGKTFDTSEFLNYASLKLMFSIAIAALTSVLTSQALTNITPLLFSTINMLGIALCAFNVKLFTNKVNFSIFKEKHLYTRCLLLVVAVVSIMYAFKMGDVNKIVPIINTRSLVLAGIGIVVYKETQIAKKLTASLITLFGAYLVIIG